MGNANKSKWIIGLTGTAFSAFVISQVGANQQEQTPTASQDKISMQSMSLEEKELYQLDWTNYSINLNETIRGGVQSDRQTKRS